MVNKPFKRQTCETCSIKLPKAHPKLHCTICNKIKHLACEKLTKADANYLIHLKVKWTCRECILQILPVNACSVPKREKKLDLDKVKIQCAACTGYSYSPRNVRTCEYCEQQVHTKCWNHALGCIKCCEEMIPGFHAYSYELLDDPYFKNDKMYNPYSSSHFTQQIGEILENEDDSNHAFSLASEILINCRYKQPSVVSPPTLLELSTFSLNIRTLANKIDKLRANITFYEKFDVLLFNETNCIKEKLTHGMSDICLPGFHDPILHSSKPYS